MIASTQYFLAIAMIWSLLKSSETILDSGEQIESIHIYIGCRRRSREQHCLVGEMHMSRSSVEIDVYCDGSNAQFPGYPLWSASDNNSFMEPEM